MANKRSLLKRVAGPGIGLAYAAGSMGEGVREFSNGTAGIDYIHGPYFTGTGADAVLHNIALPAEIVFNGIQSAASNVGLHSTHAELAAYFAAFAAAGYVVQRAIKAGIERVRASRNPRVNTGGWD